MRESLFDPKLSDIWCKHNHFNAVLTLHSFGVGTLLTAYTRKTI